MVYWWVGTTPIKIQLLAFNKVFGMGNEGVGRDNPPAPWGHQAVGDKVSILHLVSLCSPSSLVFLQSGSL